MRDMTKGAPLGHLFLYAVPLLRCWPRGWACPASPSAGASCWRLRCRIIFGRAGSGNCLRLPPRGCARRRVSKRNRRRRLLARRLKAAPQSRMRAGFPQAPVSGQRWQTLPSSARSAGSISRGRSLFACPNCCHFVTISLQSLDEHPVLCYNTKRTNHDGTLPHRFPYR